MLNTGETYMSQEQIPLRRLLVYRVWIGNIRSIDCIDDGIVIKTDENIYEIKAKNQYVEIYFLR